MSKLYDSIVGNEIKMKVGIPWLRCRCPRKEAPAPGCQSLTYWLKNEDWDLTFTHVASVSAAVIWIGTDCSKLLWRRPGSSYKAYMHYVHLCFHERDQIKLMKASVRLRSTLLELSLLCNDAAIQVNHNLGTYNFCCRTQHWTCFKVSRLRQLEGGWTPFSISFLAGNSCHRMSQMRRPSSELMTTSGKLYYASSGLAYCIVFPVMLYEGKKQ